MKSDDAVCAWIATDPSELASVRYDAAGVVFHRPSGKTHFLNQASLTLLDFLAAQPCTSGWLLERLAEKHGAEPTHQLLAQIDQILLNFEQVGLVRRAAT